MSRNEFDRIPSRDEIFGVKEESNVAGIFSQYRQILCAFLTQGGLMSSDTQQLAAYPDECDRIARPEYEEVPLVDENDKETGSTELMVARIYVPINAFPGQNLQALKMLIDEYNKQETEGEEVGIQITIESDPDTHRSFLVVHNPWLDYDDDGKEEKSHD